MAIMCLVSVFLIGAEFEMKGFLWFLPYEESQNLATRLQTRFLNKI